MQKSREAPDSSEPLHTQGEKERNRWMFQLSCSSFRQQELCGSVAFTQAVSP